MLEEVPIRVLPCQEPQMPILKLLERQSVLLRINQHRLIAILGDIGN